MQKITQKEHSISLSIVLLSLLIASLFLFGCTQPSKDQNATVENKTVKLEPTNLSNALIIASSDPTKFVFYLSWGKDTKPFSGTIHLTAKNGTVAKSYRVPQFIFINKSEICDGYRERYSELLVTFDDSPVNETWSWSEAVYCAQYSFNPWLNESQMNDIKNPKNPLFTRITSELTLDNTKFAFFFSTEYWGTPYNGTIKFISDKETKTVHAAGYLLMNKTELCVGNRDKYNTINVTFEDSPVNETWSWSNIDYCKYNSYQIWVAKDQMEAIKDPKFQFYFFEKADKGGNPLGGTLYCRNEEIGVLDNGHLNISKVDLLRKISENCSLSISGEYAGRFYEFCGWQIDPNYVTRYSEYSNYIYYESMDQQVRKGQCSPKAFITPKDPMVLSKLAEYLPYKTWSEQADIDRIANGVSRAYTYDYDKLNRIRQGGDAFMLFPSEFLVNNVGVCSDWSNAVLSLVLARDPAKCYVVVYSEYYPDMTQSSESHADVLCVINGNPRIYDQGYIFDKPSLWEDAFKNLAVEPGVTSMKPTYYYNDTFYSTVNGKEDLYAQLGIKGYG
jgi:hypothetical protein